MPYQASRVSYPDLVPGRGLRMSFQDRHCAARFQSDLPLSWPARSMGWYPSASALEVRWSRPYLLPAPGVRSWLMRQEVEVQRTAARGELVAVAIAHQVG